MANMCKDNVPRRALILIILVETVLGAGVILVRTPLMLTTLINRPLI